MAVTKRTSEIVAAATTLAAVCGSSVNPDNRDAQLSDLRLVFERARVVYIREAAVAVAKTVSGANAAALWTAASITDGMVWKSVTTGDTTDTICFTAKGAALAVGDIFQRVGAAVQYVGAQSDVTGLDALLKKTS